MPLSGTLGKQFSNDRLTMPVASFRSESFTIDMLNPPIKSALVQLMAIVRLERSKLDDARRQPFVPKL